MTKTVRLGDIADVFNGKTPSRSEQLTKGFPVLKIKDVDAKGIFKDSFSSFVSDAFAETNRKKIIKNGDVLVLNAAHNADYVGNKMFNATHEVDGAIATGEWLITRSNTPKLDPSFLWHWFCSSKTKQEIKRLVKGIHLYPKDVAELDIELPSLKDQKRISNMLDKTEFIQRKQEQTYHLTREFLKAIFLDIFSKKDFPTLPLAAVVKEQTVVTYGIVQAGPEYENGIPYIRTGDIKDGKIMTQNLRHTSPDIAAKFTRSSLNAGDIVMSIRATVGTTAVVPDELQGANLTQGTARISPGSRVTTEYLHYYLMSKKCQDWIGRQVKGATFREITLGRLRELEIPIPPISLQENFSNILIKTNKILEASKKQNDNLQNLYNSISQKAFRNKL